MSNRLGGKQGTAYVGTNAIQPPDYTFSDRDPTQYDINNVSLGDFWLNTIDEGLWVLVSLKGIVGSKGSLATWSKLEAGGISALNELTGNTGGPITADPSSNINIIGDDVGVTITGDPLTHTLTVSLVGGGIAAESFPTDDGTAIPAAGVLNIEADTASVNSGSSVSFSATGNTVTFNVTDSNDNTIIGRGSGNTTIAGGDNVVLGEGSAFALTSGDDNTIIGGTAGTGITSGSNNIIVGSGAGTLLTISDSANTLIGGEGFAGAAEFVEITAGAVGTTVLHNYPGVDASTTNGGNIFLGTDAGNFTLAGAAGDASNDGIGSGALQSLTTGARNNAMGVSALNSLTTGTNNTVIGDNAGADLVTGAHNVLMGYTAGSAYVGAESNNIVLGVVAGTAAESNVLRIASGTGTGTGQINKAFISGIRGVTPVVNDGIPLFVSSTGQLGTVGTGGTTFVSTATGNSGGAVSPLAGNINIVGDGTTATVVGNPGTHTLTISSIGGGGGTLTVLAADTGSAAPAAGTINIITDNASQICGSSVIFTGATDTIQLLVSDADDNTLIGEASGNATLTGTKNTALGTLTANSITSGINNAMLGYGAGTALTSGSYNVLLGYLSGSSYVSTETSNIAINAVGTAADVNTLRIGAGTGAGSAQLNKAFISGIRGITPTINDGIPLFINSVGQFGTVGNGGTTMVQTLTANSGGAVGPASGNINIVGDGTTVTIVGSPGTNTLTVTALGGGGGGGASVFTTDDGGAIESGGTINIITNNATQDAGATVLFSGSTDTVQLEVTDVGRNTLIGFGTGNATLSGTDNTALGYQCALALTTGSSNIFLGRQAGSLITTGSGNFLCGNANTATALKGTTTSTGLYGFGTNGSLFLHNFGGYVSENTFVGYDSGSFNAGQQSSSRNNTGCGSLSLSSLTSGTNNVAIGKSAAFGITSGSSNTLLGVSAGSNYASSESSNICIGRNTSGTVAESNVCRIATGTGTGTGQVNKTFIAGIRGITTGISNAIPVLIDSAGQLGTAGGGSVITSLTGNSGGAVSATAGNVNVRGDGTTISVAGSPGTSTLTISAIGGGGNNPAFAAYLANTYTAPSAVSTVRYDAVEFNLGGDFDTSTSVFTASVTGLYNFTVGVLYDFILGAPAPVDCSIRLNTAGRNFLVSWANYSNMKQVVTASSSVLLQQSNNFYTHLDAGDYALVQKYLPTGSSTVRILGAGGGGPVGFVGTVFGGMLVSE
jgi:hypothetical protein